MSNCSCVSNILFGIIFVLFSSIVLVRSRSSRNNIIFLESLFTHNQYSSPMYSISLARSSITRHPRYTFTFVIILYKFVIFINCLFIVFEKIKRSCVFISSIDEKARVWLHFFNGIERWISCLYIRGKRLVFIVRKR